MKFKKISFSNYRCFLNGTIDFEENNDRNINILVGPNGGGKTELLFSFWWVLYGYDFSKLTGKEDTAYALNSDLYKNLMESEKGTEEKCSVELSIENNGTVYNLTKSCIFRKTEQRIKVDEWQTLAKSLPNGETSTPINQPEEISLIIGRIIPKNVLYGILFDGERMQKLSSPNDIAKNAIKGVITDITNVHLIEKSIQNFESISKQLTKESKNIANRIGDKDLETIINNIETLSIKRKETLETLSKYSDDFDKKTARIMEISDELQKIDDVRKIESQRITERQIMENNETLLEKYYKNLSASLNDGYILISEDLLTKVEDLLQKYDVPEGLTVDAVKSILDRTNCICGHELHEQEIENLKKLISQLPPDNISSTFAEAIRQTRAYESTLKQTLKRDYNLIRDTENNIKKSKSIIAELSTKIDSYDNKTAKELESENNKLREEIGVIKSNTPILENTLKECEKQLLDGKELRDTMGKSEIEISNYNKQLTFIDKSLKAFEEIKNQNKIQALKEINSSLQDSYKNLSEDAKLGKQIYIIQYDPVRQYQMVIYLKDNYDKLYKSWCDCGKYNQLISEGLSDAEIEEQIIIECIDSNSTGQSKMNTLSFVKAILDYSNKKKDDAEFGITKSYPFLIDAPFGDIAGDNLINSAKQLHTFSEQIILMLDTDKYNNIKEYLSPYLSKKYKFEKFNKNFSSITPMED